MSVDGLAIHGVFVHHLVMLTGLCQQAALLRSAHRLVHKGSVWQQQGQLVLMESTRDSQPASQPGIINQSVNQGQSTSQSTRHCQPASQPGTVNQPVNQGQSIRKSARHNQPGTVNQASGPSASDCLISTTAQQ